MMDRERIEQELVQARQERETFIRQAERQIAMLDGAILALERVLASLAGAAPATAGEPA